MIQIEVVPNSIEKQKLIYNRSRKQDTNEKDPSEEFNNAKQYLMQTQIQCFKYNNSLDKEVQKANCFDSFMTLSSDGKRLLITNRIQVNDLNADNFISETAIRLQPNLGEEANI